MDNFITPGKGIHAYRLFNLAIVDVIGTIIFAIGLSYILKINVLITILSVFLLGIITHRLFHIRTTIDRLLFV